MLTTGRWRRRGLWLLGLLVAAITLALGLNWLIIAPLIPGRTSPLVRRLEPFPLTEGLGISAGVEVTAQGPNEGEPAEEEAIDLSQLLASVEEDEAASKVKASGNSHDPPRRSNPIDLPDGFRAMGSQTYLVNRSWLQNAGKRGPGALASPYVVQGRVQGYRLRAVGGPLSQLGLRSGDVITAVNGQKTNSPDNALRAYQRSYKAKVIQVALLRGGAPTTLTYQMVD